MTCLCPPHYKIISDRVFHLFLLVGEGFSEFNKAGATPDRLVVACRSMLDAERRARAGCLIVPPLMFTDLDAADSADSSRDGASTPDVEETRNDTDDAKSLPSLSTDASSEADTDDDLDDDRGGTKTHEKEKQIIQLDADGKELPARTKPKSLGKKMRELIYGPDIVTDWVFLGDPFTCGVKARKPYVPGTRKEPIKYMAIDESILPGTQVKFVCTHAEGAQKIKFLDMGETCEVCLDAAKRRLFSVASRRFHFYKDEENVEFKDFNTAAYWNEVGVSWEDPYRVEPWDYTEKRLVEKFIFGENNLLCLAFEEQLFWNVVRYYLQSRNPDAHVARASEWHRACKYTNKEHRKVKHFGTLFKKLFEDYAIEMKGRTMPIPLKKLMQTVPVYDEEYTSFEKWVEVGENDDGSELDFDGMGAHGWRSMHIAAMKNEPRLIDPLLKKGAELSPFDGAGYTPLHYAALYGKEEAGLLLIKHGADVYLKNREGNDALQVALNMGHKTMALAWAKTKNFYDDVLRRVEEFYLLLFAGDATLYDPRYGAGEHMELGWKEGCRELGHDMFLYKLLTLGIAKKRSWFKSKAAKGFSILTFYDFDEVMKMGMSMLKCKKVKDVKHLVARYDPVGSKKHHEKPFRPIIKHIFKMSKITKRKMQPKELHERALGGREIFDKWATGTSQSGLKNTPDVDVKFENIQEKIWRKAEAEKEKLQAAKEAADKKNKKKKKKG